MNSFILETAYFNGCDTFNAVYGIKTDLSIEEVQIQFEDLISQYSKLHAEYVAKYEAYEIALEKERSKLPHNKAKNYSTQLDAFIKFRSDHAPKAPISEVKFFGHKLDLGDFMPRQGGESTSHTFSTLDVYFNNLCAE